MIYIYNTLLDHDYAAFSLIILEFIDILSLLKNEYKFLILKKILI